MIIRSIEIENFGRFHDWKLDGLGYGVNPVVGANEFGKTTLLEFIRRIFWGFPDRRSLRNPYPALEGRGAYGGRLITELASGETLTIERLGESRGGSLRLIRDGERVSEEQSELDALFGLGENFYRSVYAITVEELAAARSLDHEEIRSRLYGAGVASGALSLSALGAFFDKRAAELCTPRGRKHEIARLREQLLREEELLAGALALRPRFEEAVRLGAGARREREMLSARLAENAVRIAAARRRAEALRLLKLWREAAAEAVSLPEPPAGFSADSARREAELAAACVAAKARRDRFAAAVRELEERPRDPRAASALPAREPEVLALEQRLGRYRQAEQELRRSGELAGVARNHRERLAEELAGILAPGEELPPIDGGALERAREFRVRQAALEARRGAVPPVRISGAFWCLGTLLWFLAGVGIYAWNRDFRPLMLVAVPALGWVLSRRFRQSAADPGFAEFERDLRDFLREFRFESEPPVSELAAILEKGGLWQQLGRELAERNAEAVRLQRELDDFRFECARFPETRNLPPPEGVARLRKLLEEARGAKLREELAAGRLHEARHELELAGAESGRAHEALEAFYRECRVSDRAGFLELLRREQRRGELAARAAAQRKNFETYWGDVSPAAVEALERGPEADVAALERERAELAAALRQCDSRSGAADADAERLRTLSDGSAAALRAESLRGELKSAAREYLIWREARALLDRAVGRYERERQPEVIRRAAELFRNFTGGRYVSMRKSLTTGELLLTDSAVNREKTVGELSRGTLGELMIAMRLALIECREEGREPLPVVLDDVLVDFDPVRRSAVLAALEKFASGRQILLFGSC